MAPDWAVTGAATGAIEYVRLGFTSPDTGAPTVATSAAGGLETPADSGDGSDEGSAAAGSGGASSPPRPRTTKRDFFWGSLTPSSLSGILSLTDLMLAQGLIDGA